MTLKTNLTNDFKQRKRNSPRNHWTISFIAGIVAVPYAHLAAWGVSTNSDVVVIRKIIKTFIIELEMTIYCLLSTAQKLRSTSQCEDITHVKTKPNGGKHIPGHILPRLVTQPIGENRWRLIYFCDIWTADRINEFDHRSFSSPFKQRRERPRKFRPAAASQRLGFKTPFRREISGSSSLLLGQRWETAIIKFIRVLHW